MKNEDDSLRRPDAHRQLPICPLSTQCWLYADKLDSSDSSSRAYLGDDEDVDDVREERLIEQLRSHVLTCSTCRAIIADVQEQREAIRISLREGEREVPSTTARIIAAIRQETTTDPLPQQPLRGDNRYLDELPLHQRIVETPIPKRRNVRWMETLSIAVAAVLVLATLGVLGRLLLLHGGGSAGSANSSVSTGSTSSGAVLAPSASWSSVVVTYTLNNQTVIANYTPLSGQNVSLASFSDAQVAVDGVAHSGDEVLYHVFDGTQTRYYLYPETQQPIYTTTGSGGAAFWSSGDSDHYVFINTKQGVAQIDMVAHSSRLLAIQSATPKAIFYRNGYLYFVQVPNSLASYSSGRLYRLDLHSNKPSPIQVTPCPDSTNFWLSPVSSTVYYSCPMQEQNALYAVNGDGTNAHLLRSNAGEIVGYAADNSLLMLQVNNGRYQVVQLGASPQQDQVLLSDIAPGATSVHQSDVAVAPYGYALVAKATYANNLERLWYGDTMTQAMQQVQLPIGVRNINAVGWDRLIPTMRRG